MPGFEFWTASCSLVFVLMHIYVFMCVCMYFFHGVTAPSGAGPPHYRGFTNIPRHTTLGRTPVDEWSARRRDLYPTTHNPHNRQTSMPPAWSEPAIPVSERPQSHALYRAATGTVYIYIYIYIHICIYVYIYGRGVDSASKRNEYQEYFLGG
jgi:hypothetical protein